MTVCKLCKGVGYVGIFEPAELTDCPSCDGKGVIEPLTNEEYLKSCTTEQLAEYLADVCYGLLDDVWGNDGDTSCDYRETEKNYWVEWLKQPHTP